MLSKEEYVEKIVRDILNGEMKLEDFVSEHFELVKEYKEVRKELECYYEMMSNAQPYKFEDLKEVIGNPIYDEKYKEFYILSKVKEEEIYKDEGIEKFMICSDKKGLIRVLFEENRFFPVQMANARCE